MLATVAVIVVTAPAAQARARAGAKVFRLSGGETLVVPNASVTPGTRLNVHRTTSRRAGALSVKVVRGRVVGDIFLTVPFNRKVRTSGMPLTDTVQLAYYNQPTRDWTTVPTRVDRSHHRLLATISVRAWDQASLLLGGRGGSGSAGSTWWNPFTWDWGNIALRLDQRVGEIRGARTGPANCSTGLGPPSWADVGVNNGADLPIRTCAERQGNTAVVQIVNNRPYGMILKYGAPVSWGWHQAASDLAGAARNGFADVLVSPNELYLPPLQAASVGVPMGSWWFATFQASVTKKSLAADVLSIALDQADSVIRSSAFGALAAHCSWLLKPSLDTGAELDHGSILDNVDNLAGCLKDAVVSLAGSGLLDGVKVDKLQHSLELLSRVNKVAVAAKLAGALGDLFVGTRGSTQANGTFTVRRLLSTVSGPAPSPTPAPAPGPGPTPSPGPGPSPGTAPPPHTWSETVGGNAHTWTNYTNAGGTQGPTIPAYATVQIACKVPGFRVADGDTWWYRIASSPWNNQFYVSADAFYNNGRTSGSLVGTPFVDGSVANC